MRNSVKNRRWSLRTGLVAAGAALAVAAGTAAWAVDTVFPDGDTGVASPNLAYGSGANDHACASRGTAVSGQITVDYNGTGLEATKHFTPGESLTVSYAPPLGSGITVTPGTVPDVPGGWGSSQGDSFTIPFTTTVPASIADGGYAVEVTVTGDISGYSAGDGAATPGKPKFQVLVDCAATAPANTAPSVAFSSAPTSATEGDVKAYSFAITDPDAGQTFSYAAGSPNCGSLGSVSGTPTIDSTTKTGSFSCSFPDGLVPATASTVSVQVTDGTAFSNTATTSTTVNNADPVVSALTLGGNTGTACLAGKTVTLDFGFSDLGVNDNPWGIDVNWGNGTTPTYYVGTQGNQTQLSNVYFGAGSWTVGVTVTDKDTGAGSNSSGAGAVSFLYSTGQGILQPINYTGPRSSFKIGSTIPVKIKITDCIGTPVSGLAPQVSLRYLDGSPDGVAVEDFYSTVPDQGTSMRYTGSPDYQYIYNLGTKGRNTGDYSVTVSDATIAPVTAFLSLRK